MIKEALGRREIFKSLSRLMKSEKICKGVNRMSKALRGEFSANMSGDKD